MNVSRRLRRRTPTWPCPNTYARPRTHTKHILASSQASFPHIPRNKALPRPNLSLLPSLFCVPPPLSVFFCVPWPVAADGRQVGHVLPGAGPLLEEIVRGPRGTQGPLPRAALPPHLRTVKHTTSHHKDKHKHIADQHTIEGHPPCLDLTVHLSSLGKWPSSPQVLDPPFTSALRWLSGLSRASRRRGGRICGCCPCHRRHSYPSSTHHRHGHTTHRAYSLHSGPLVHIHTAQPSHQDL